MSVTILIMQAQSSALNTPQPVSPQVPAIMCLLVLAGVTLWVYQQRIVTLPDFTGYATVQEKKQAFFAYLIPRIEHANKQIMVDRKKLELLQYTLGNQAQLTWFDRVQLNNIAARYHIKSSGATSDQALLASALLRVNVIPSSLILVQAAKESGWGTSKFARQANNLFGQQCFTQGCGMVPDAREVNRQHEVARFKRPAQSVAAYLKNLNTHPRYRQLRAIRAAQTAAGETLRGTSLAEGLLAYSERREAYVREVQAMIRHNELE